MIDIPHILNMCNIPYQEYSKFYKIRCLNLSAHGNGDQDPSLCIYKDSYIGYCYTCRYSIHIEQIYKKFTGKNIGKKERYYYQKSPEIKKKEIGEVIMRGEIDSIFNNDIAYEYCKEKGLTKEFIKFFNVKYAKKVHFLDKDGNIHLNRLSKPIILYNRLAFPIVENNKIVGMELRDVTGNSKLKVFYPRDSCTSTLFGIDNLDITKPLHLVEGIKSLWKLWTIEKNSTTCFGVAINSEQRKLLYKFPEIIIWPDNDKAGNKFINYLEKFYDKPIYVCWRNNLDKSDPNDYSIDEIKKMNQNKVLLNKMDLEESGLFDKPQYKF